MNIARVIARATRPLRDNRGSQHPAGAQEIEVDVREDLRMGREPFPRIMAAVADLRPDQVLRVRAIFEPVPLFHALRKRGFEYESEPHGPDDWSVWFWRPEAAAAPSIEAAAPVAGDGTCATATDDTLWLDVRGLQPPEPLMKTLAALDALRAGQTLVQIHNRVPQLLFPLLVERGFACDVDERDPARILVRIWRASGGTTSP